MATPSLVIHDDAVGDLEAIERAAAPIAAKVWALLQQIQADPDLLDKLLDDGFGEDGQEPFAIRKWVRQWNQNRDLWRLKIWALERQGIQYRVIYAYHWRELRYYVLGVVPRSFDYDEASALGKRILAACDGLS
jgi:mRNA-degrading endonuclease RelE of RelBE toxin-antitoxin system